MVVKGRTKVPLAVTKERIGRKSELKLLGVTFNEDPCNWDAHFEHMLEKASSRFHIFGESVNIMVTLYYKNLRSYLKA